MHAGFNECFGAGEVVLLILDGDTQRQHTLRVLRVIDTQTRALCFGIHPRLVERLRVADLVLRRR